MACVRAYELLPHSTSAADLIWAMHAYVLCVCVCPWHCALVPKSGICRQMLTGSSCCPDRARARARPACRRAGGRGRVETLFTRSHSSSDCSSPREREREQVATSPVDNKVGISRTRRAKDRTDEGVLLRDSRPMRELSIDWLSYLQRTDNGFSRRCKFV